jgi:hypothetical protein
VYEDDGSSVAYLENSFGFIEVNYEGNDERLHIRVSAIGSYSTSICNRRITIRIPDRVAPDEIESKLDFSTRFDGHDVYVEITFLWDLDKDGESFEVDLLWKQPLLDLSGIKAGLHHARLTKAVLDEVVLTPGSHPCWHSKPCGYRPSDDHLIRAAVSGERLHVAKNRDEIESIVKNFIQLYRVAVESEITVDNVLRTDTDWAPTQGGWPEATRLRVNYAVTTLYWSMEKLCEQVSNFIMPLICNKTPPPSRTPTDDVVIILDV